MKHEDYFMMKKTSSSIQANRIAYAHTQNFSVKELIKLSKDFYGYKSSVGIEGNNKLTIERQPLNYSD